MASAIHKVMISSTYKELEKHRDAVSEAALGQWLFPIDMGNDSADPRHDLISASLAKVEAADAYVGLISYRYGQVVVDTARNPGGFSLTELEYRRALERDLPRCMFIMHADHPVPSGVVGGEDDAARKKLAAFKALVMKDRIYAEFESVADLKAKAVQSLALLRDLLDKGLPAIPPAAAPSSDDIPAPPAFYAKPPYIPGYAFQGRVKELAALSDWAGSADNLMLLEAIGGMGKSMVTWEWVNKYAARDRTDWAGRFWYSFYEGGASMRDFCVTALAYMTRRPRETLQTQPTHALAEQLLRPLRVKPWLLVLDGLERVLVAYYRSDAAQIPDEKVAADGDVSGAQTACIRPDDEDLLRQLCAAAPSKILATSRLTPRALLNAAGQPLPGARRLQLVGLDPRDAEAMMRALGVSGDGERMRLYLEQKFGCHPLIVGVAAGLALKHFKALGNFDHWVDDPDGGAAVDLTDSDIRQRKTHILKQAFDGLDPFGRELMARLAMISAAVDREVLEALNPASPAPPEKVVEPSAPDFAVDFWIEHLREQLAAAATGEERAGLEQQILDYEGMRREAFETEKQAYAQYRTDLDAWRTSEALRSAQRKLKAGVVDLEQRGLLQCDRRSGQFDLHPVVRGYAVQSLDAGARAETGQRVADYFSSRARTPYEHATSLTDLQNGIHVVQALNLAGKTQEAWDVFTDGFRAALNRLELHHEALALMRAFFPAGWLALPTGVRDAAIVADEAAIHLYGTGLIEESIFQATFSIQEGARQRLSENLSISLHNVSECFIRNGRWAARQRLTHLSRKVAQAVGHKDHVLWRFIDDVSDLTNRGQLTDALGAWNAIEEPLQMATFSRKGQFEVDALLARVGLLFRTGALTDAVLSSAIARTRSLGWGFHERALWSLRGQWLQATGDDAAGADSFAQVIAIARTVGLRDADAEARRGFSLARLGRRSEADAAAASAERDPPHDALAELYWQLGERDKARHYAVEGYKRYWGDGPPYASHWHLQACRAVLEKLCEPEPSMAPFDPAKIEPFPFEADIRRLLAEHAEKKGKK